MQLIDYSPVNENRTLSVSELTEKIKNLLEDNFFDIYVTGEISNIARPISGHIYFTLKDEYSSIKCVLFRYQNRFVNFNYKNGDKVIVRGSLKIYEKRGEYQIIVDFVEPDGKGLLYLQFEKLKKKLLEEGLFDEKHKKKIPEFPKKIALITSPTGAAIRDILKILKRRYANLYILVAPVKVQGEKAKYEIVEAINILNLYFSDIDTIIIARGGGSFEDLQPFNEEIVARAIFKSNIPIITAIGHETDFTIADFTADLRAPTPSAAAELVVKNKEDLLLHLSNLEKQLIANIEKILNFKKQKFLSYEKILFSHLLKLKNLKNKIHNLENTLNNGIYNLISEKKYKYSLLKDNLTNQNPLLKIEKLKNRLSQNRNNLIFLIENILSKNKQELKLLNNSLNTLSPLNVLARGYSIVFKNENVITDKEQIKINDNVKILLHKGNFRAKVYQIGGEK